MRKIKKPSKNIDAANSLIKATHSFINTNEENAIKAKDLTAIQQHSRNISGIVSDITEIFPDIELVIEIMTSLIISPNDMQNNGVYCKLSNFKLPVNIQNIIMDVSRTYINDEYDYLDKLDTIISETLYTKGSYVELNIPPSNIKKLLDTIKKAPKAGLEDIMSSSKPIFNTSISTYKEPKDSFIEFSDNPLNICSDILNDTMIKVGNEASLFNTEYNETTIALENMFIDNNGYGVMDDNDINYDKPIIKKIDSFNVIPVCAKNDPNKHYGYFIFLDDKGLPIKETTLTVDETVNIFKKVKHNIKGISKSTPTITNIDDIRRTFLGDKLNSYLKESKYNNLIDSNINIDNNLMLSIADTILNDSKLKIIFMPEELVSYYAINYRSNGTGESLLERTTVLASIRGIIMFTNLLSYIKSSTTTTEVTVDLDPEDPNFRKTSEMIMGNIMSNRQVSLPIGMLKADDFVDWSHKLGYSFNFKHPAAPDVNIDISENNVDISPIDSDLKEDIDKLLITSLYLTPEILDNSYSPDFATTVIANNLLLSKRVAKLQRKFNALITKDIRKKLLLDGSFKNKIKDILGSEIKSIKKYILKSNNPNVDKDVIKKIKDDVLIDWIANTVIKHLAIELPKPEVTDDSNSKDLLDDFIDEVDKITDILMSTDAIPDDLLGDFADKMDDAKAAIKVMLTKRYINENNILPELTNILTLDEDGNPNNNILEEFSTHIDVLTKLILPFVKDNNKAKEKLDEKIDKIDNPDEDEEDTSDAVDETNNDDTGDTTDDNNNDNEDTNNDDTVDNEDNTEEEDLNLEE